MENKTYTLIAKQEDINKRLDVFLSEKLSELTRSAIKNAIEKELVTVNNKNVKSGTKLKQGDQVKFEQALKTAPNLTPQDLPLEIVFENNNLMVVNKPKGMVVHAGNGNQDGTMVNALLFKQKQLSGVNGEFRPGIVHRLDKDTSGLLLVAKNDKAHVNLAKQIETKTCKRIYHAIVVGNLKQDDGTIETNIARDKRDRTKFAVSKISEGKHAITHYKVLERFKGYCYVQFQLETGRTHQIRVHCKHLGHSIVGDNVYGGKTPFKISGQLLIAKKIVFFEPETNQELSFEIPLTQEFEQVLNKLRSSI